MQRCRLADRKSRVNHEQLGTFQSARAFPGQGVPINGQQITLPFPLLWEDLWKRSWQEATVKKDNSASRVLHFLSGKGERAVWVGEGSLL